MEQKSNSVESAVMDRIATGRVKLRSRWIFLAERIAFDSALLLGALGAVLVFSLVFFYLRETETLQYLVFGREGLYAFLEAFPFGLVIAFVLFVFASAALLRRTEVSYKKPFIAVVVVFLSLIVGAGFVFAKTEALNQLEVASYKENFVGRSLRPLFRGGTGMTQRQHGFVGRVREADETKVTIQTPDGVRVIDLDDVHGDRRELVPGAFIMGVGARKGEHFSMTQYRIVPEPQSHMMKRRIRHMFDAVDGIPTSTVK